MKALILAAGLGHRLGALTSACPKPLVAINGRPLIAHVLASLRHPNITAIGLVGGFQYAQLRTAVLALCPEIRCFYNPRYALGSIESLFAAREFLTSDFLVCNADHVYRPAIVERICATAPGVTAVCDFDRALGRDDMKVRRGANGLLTAIHKELTACDGGYIGMARCPTDMITAYWAAAEQTRAHQGPTASVDWVLGTLAQTHPVHICDASGIGWVEVDTVEDLIHAEKFLHH